MGAGRRAAPLFDLCGCGEAETETNAHPTCKVTFLCHEHPPTLWRSIRWKSAQELQMFRAAPAHRASQHLDAGSLPETIGSFVKGSNNGCRLVVEAYEKTFFAGAGK